MTRDEPEPSSAFRTSFLVRPADIDALGHVNNLVWLRWVVDIAGEHSESVGLGLAAYRELGVLWVVRKHEIEYLGSAYDGETIDAATWISGARAATSTRRTTFRRSGRLLAHATTTWALIQIATGRPTRITSELAARYGVAL